MNDHDQRYADNKPLYTRLKDNVTQILNGEISNRNIPLFNVESRVKDLKSFNEKIKSGGYLNPFDDIEDICGVRVICYYNSDMDIIEEIIKKEFVVISDSDKQKEAGDDKFGYASRHYVVKIKGDWLEVPIYRGLGELKVEIQLRTMLMHSWAAISHKLLYKKESNVPRELKRKLNRLSALIELADEQFEAIRIDKEIYFKNFEENFSEYTNPEVMDELLNSDNLTSLVQKFSPGREFSNSDVPRFLDEIEKYKLTVKDFYFSIKKAEDILGELETAEANFCEGELPLWNLVGYCRTIMDLTNDDYFEQRWAGGDGISNADVLHLTKHFRERLNSSTN